MHHMTDFPLRVVHDAERHSGTTDTLSICHCDERSEEAIRYYRATRDCFARKWRSLAVPDRVSLAAAPGARAQIQEDRCTLTPIPT